LSKEFEDNEVKEYVTRSGQSQKKMEEIMLQLKKGQNDIKTTRRKDEINKIKSRVLLFLDYPHDTGAKLPWKVSNYLPKDMASYPRKRVHSEI
jgi:hypothetical protein